MTAYQLDFDELKRRVRIEDAAYDMLGLTLKNDKDGLRTCCPTCSPDNPRAIHIDTKTQQFCCFSADKIGGKTFGGDVIRFVSHTLGIKSQYAAAQKLIEHFGEPTAPQQRPRPQPPAKREQEPSGGGGIQSVRARLVFEHEDVQALGISPAAAEVLGVGFMAKGTMPNRVLFPIRDESGEILAYCGIAVNEDQQPRFKFPRDFEEVLSNVVELRRKA